MATTSTLTEITNKQALVKGADSNQATGKLPTDNKQDLRQELALNSTGKDSSSGGKAGAYEPPPDIGAPKRTSGRSGR